MENYSQNTTGNLNIYLEIRSYVTKNTNSTIIINNRETFLQKCLNFTAKNVRSFITKVLCNKLWNLLRRPLSFINPVSRSSSRGHSCRHNIRVSCSSSSRSHCAYEHGILPIWGQALPIICIHDQIWNHRCHCQGWNRRSKFQDLGARNLSGRDLAIASSSDSQLCLLIALELHFF